MPIIYPSLIPLPMDRLDPEPGVYVARLVDVTRYEKAGNKPCLKMKWELLNHPGPDHHTFFAFGHYGLVNTGLLSQFFYGWKGKLWSEILKMQEEDGRHAPERFIGDEAIVYVQARENAQGHARAFVAGAAPPPPDRRPTGIAD